MRILNNKLAARISENERQFSILVNRMFAADAVQDDVKKAANDIAQRIANDVVMLACHGYAMDGTRIARTVKITSALDDKSMELNVRKVAQADAASRDILQKDSRTKAILEAA